MKRAALALFLSTISCCYALADRVPLGDVRKRLVGHSIVLLDNGDFSTWLATKEKKGRYLYSIMGSPAAALAGAHAVVVSVDFYQGFDPPQPDVDGSMVDSFYVTIRTQDGKLLSCVTSISGLIIQPSFEEVSVVDQHKVEIQRLADEYKGKTVYLTSRNYVYDLGLTVSQALAATRGMHSNAASIVDFPRLRPLTVVAVSFSEKFDYAVATIQIRPDRLGELVFDYNTMKGSYNLPFLTEVPRSFTDDEISAIRAQQVFVGMSREALWASQGLAEKINLYGDTEQWVYADGHYAYIDATGHVTSSQHIQ